jgi:hypothetical protein
MRELLESLDMNLLLQLIYIVLLVIAVISILAIIYIQEPKLQWISGLIGASAIILLIILFIAQIYAIQIYLPIILFLCGVIVIFDGILSLLTRYKDGTHYNIGRILRIVVGFYITLYSMQLGLI